MLRILPYFSNLTVGSRTNFVGFAITVLKCYHKVLIKVVYGIHLSKSYMYYIDNYCQIKGPHIFSGGKVQYNVLPLL